MLIKMNSSRGSSRGLEEREPERLVARPSFEEQEHVTAKTRGFIDTVVGFCLPSVTPAGPG